ncbi:nuclease [Halobacillus litoralis]|uniref:Nuclease n=2 Tax=Halobacillus litoralis TaxID=45668 RepID=A0A410MIX9_9BACI|nr:nuclease [Halobacillus litoralis]
MVQDKSGVSVTKIERPFSRKFLGFRSNKLWKKATVISTYIVTAILLIGLFFGQSEDKNDSTQSVAKSYGDVESTETDNKLQENNNKNTPSNTTNASDDSKSDSTNNIKEEASFPEDSEEATVTRIVDGDTIEVNIDGEEQGVRLLLVDTPETKHPNLPVQDYGPEASKFAKDTLSGEEVHIEYDGPKTDKYGRLLAYIWIDGTTFNKMLLEGGYARYAYVYDPPYTHAEEFQAAEASAKSQNLRIWSEEGYVTKDGFLQKKKVPQSTVPTAGDLEFDPNGPDRNCGDFSSQESAQAFFEAAGGPEKDPHQLDGSDGDGLVCESL